MKGSVGMLKRIISFIIITGIINGMLITYADDTAVQEQSIPTANQIEAAELLSALQIIAYKSGQEILPDKVITRAEMATLAMRTIGLDTSELNTTVKSETKSDDVDLFKEAEEEEETPKEELVNEDRVFSDVPKEHWAYENIQKATALGFISGYYDGTFAPDSPINYSESVKILVCLAGYKVMAEIQGGYPVGYLNVAKDKKLLKSINAPQDGILTTGDCYVMLYNLLHVEVLYISSVGRDITYKTGEDRTFMKEYLDVVYKKGIVEAVPQASIMPDVKPIKNRVRISGEVYEIGSTNAGKLLGRNVSFYAKEDEKDTQTLLYVKEDKKNVIVEIRADMLSSIQGTQSVSGGEIVYFENDETEKIKINKDATYVYNNEILAVVSDDRLMIENGTITLVDQNDDGSFDVVIIFDYLTYLVDSLSINDSTATIKDKLGKPSFTFSSNNAVIRKGDNEIDLESIKQGEVVEVLKKISVDDNSAVEAIVVTEFVTGILNELSDDKVVVDDKTYSISPFADTSNFKLNISGEFRFDILGRIVGLQNAVTSDYIYGYLIDLFVKTGIDDKVYFKLADKKNEPLVLEMHKRAKINDEKKTIAQIESIFANRQLIQYKTDENNKITAVNTALIKDNKGIDLQNFSRDYVSNGIAYNNYQHRYGEMYSAVNSTAVFIIPASEDELDAKYYVKGATSLLTTNVTSYPNVQVYDADANYQIGALVIQSEVGGGGIEIENTEVYIIDTISQILNEDGEQSYKLKYMNHLGTVKESVIDDPELELDSSWGYNLKVGDLRRGDIITITTDTFGKLNNIAVYFTAKTAQLSGSSKYMCKNTQHKSEDTNEVFVHSNVYITFEKVLEKSADTVILKGRGENGIDKNVSFNFYSKKVFLYDSKRNELKLSSMSEVYEGDEVFIHSYYQYPRMMVIYR